MQFHDRPVRLLASVTNDREALIACDGGADIIDAKDPSQGALGALSLERVGAIGRAVAGRAPVSATIGDLPCEADIILDAVADYAATGIDAVKVGFFPGGNARDVIGRLGEINFAPVRLVGVLLADRDPDFSLIPEMAKARFAAVVLDTADKASGSLPDVMSDLKLRTFIALAQSMGLLAGLAGALRVVHISRLLTLNPDILGFRGALCAGTNRHSHLEATALSAVRAAIPSFTYQSEGRHAEPMGGAV